MTGFDLGGEIDSSGDFMNFESAIMDRQRHINILDDQSDGEIGPSYTYDQTESYGEIKPGKISKEAAAQGRYKGASNYEGGLNSHSGTQIDIENPQPIRDSFEPVQKTKKKINGKNGQINAMSNDSFGKNPLNRSSGGDKIVKNGKKGVPHREQIQENFLEDDDYEESGEINPGMFR